MLVCRYLYSFPELGDTPGKGLACKGGGEFGEYPAGYVEVLSLG